MPLPFKDVDYFMEKYILDYFLIESESMGGKYDLREVFLDVLEKRGVDLRVELFIFELCTLPGELLLEMYLTDSEKASWDIIAINLYSGKYENGYYYEINDEDVKKINKYHKTSIKVPSSFIKEKTKYETEEYFRDALLKCGITKEDIDVILKNVVENNWIPRESYTKKYLSSCYYYKISSRTKDFEKIKEEIKNPSKLKCISGLMDKEYPLKDDFIKELVDICRKAGICLQDEDIIKIIKIAAKKLDRTLALQRAFLLACSEIANYDIENMAAPLEPGPFEKVLSSLPLDPYGKRFSKKIFIADDILTEQSYEMFLMRHKFIQMQKAYHKGLASKDKPDKDNELSLDLKHESRKTWHVFMPDKFILDRYFRNSKPLTSPILILSSGREITAIPWKDAHGRRAVFFINHIAWLNYLSNPAPFASGTDTYQPGTKAGGDNMTKKNHTILDLRKAQYEESKKDKTKPEEKIETILKKMQLKGFQTLSEDEKKAIIKARKESPKINLMARSANILHIKQKAMAHCRRVSRPWHIRILSSLNILINQIEDIIDTTINQNQPLPRPDMDFISLNLAPSLMTMRGAEDAKKDSQDVNEVRLLQGLSQCRRIPVFIKKADRERYIAIIKHPSDGGDPDLAYPVCKYDATKIPTHTDAQIHIAISAEPEKYTYKAVLSKDSLIDKLDFSDEKIRRDTATEIDSVTSEKDSHTDWFTFEVTADVTPIRKDSVMVGEHPIYTHVALPRTRYRTLLSRHLDKGIGLVYYGNSLLQPEERSSDTLYEVKAPFRDCDTGTHSLYIVLTVDPLDIGSKEEEISEKRLDEILSQASIYKGDLIEKIQVEVKK